VWTRKVSSRSSDDAGVGVPAYYEWRTRSGCYFCFFQRKAEWIGLADRHPELFDRPSHTRTRSPLKTPQCQGRKYTWSGSETLRELLARREDILEKHKAAVNREREARGQRPLIDVWLTFWMTRTINLGAWSATFDRRGSRTTVSVTLGAQALFAARWRTCSGQEATAVMRAGRLPITRSAATA